MIIFSDQIWHDSMMKILLWTRFGQISCIFLYFTSDNVYIKLLVTNQLLKICNMHVEILFSGHLKLHEQPKAS